mgnify:CR=1 FL=1
MAGFADLYSQLQKTLGATQRVRELLKEPGESVSVVKDPLQEKYKLTGRGSFKNVYF